MGQILKIVKRGKVKQAYAFELVQPTFIIVAVVIYCHFNVLITSRRVSSYLFHLPGNFSVPLSYLWHIWNMNRYIITPVIIIIIINIIPIIIIIIINIIIYRYYFWSQ